jgi:Tfp pilus assembly protein PilN
MVPQERKLIAFRGAGNADRNDYNINKISEMKKPLEVWQAIIASVLMLLTVGTIISTQASRITNQQDRINFLEENKATTEAQFHEVNMNLHEVNSKLTDILVELQNKKDRDK